MKGENKMRRTGKTGMVAQYGILIALAFLLSYLETMFPLPVPVPGMKLGLANLVTIVGLYTVGIKGTVMVSVVRVILAGFTFGNLFSMWYSMAGCILSLVCMIGCRRLKRFGILGVSAIGGVAHNVGQLCMAAFLVEHTAVFYYLPVLLVAGMAAGCVIGLTGGMIISRIGDVLRRYGD